MDLKQKKVSRQGFGTAAIHTEIPRDLHDVSTSMVPPIMMSSTYEIPSNFQLTDTGKFLYNRYGNITRNTLEMTLAKLEGAAAGAATFSSGMSAINAVVQAVLKQGDNIVTCKQVYGGTYNLFKNDLPRFGISCTMVDRPCHEAIIQAITNDTKMVWVEVCTNPLIEILDVAKLAKAIKAYHPNVILALDNTFLSPYVIRPLELGADIVMHSGTKYLGGHSDVLMGVVACRDQDLMDEVRAIQNHNGAVPGAMDCYLMTRSLWTLEVRMQKHHESGLKIAHYLQDHPAVTKVIHPLLPSHPQHKLALTQHTGAHSGMVAFYVEGGKETAQDVIGGLNLIKSAVSLGGVHSLASYPGNITHGVFSAEDKETLELEGLVRLSVGLEAAEDITEDLEQALAKATGITSRVDGKGHIPNGRTIA